MELDPTNRYDHYMDQVKEHGYLSMEAKLAYDVWAAAAGHPSGRVRREEHTAKPFGDNRPLAEIYPGRLVSS